MTTQGDDSTSASSPDGGPAPEDYLPTTDGKPPDGFDSGLEFRSWIGPFRVLDLLGEGGMGVVYLAEQQVPIRRKLAVKLIRSSLTTQSAAARFEAERQAMARLSHPNIAQILEAGTTKDGFPYFAMEYVKGEAITSYCDERRVSIDDRLRLFITVCQGVLHAHRRGILHRDIKPSNILVTEVDGEPVPKIIDFGVAKALDDPLTDATRLTVRGIPGTPAYMSPESFALEGETVDVDTRTDVYSLGVLLFELLVGRFPFDFDGGRLEAILRRVVLEEPMRPSRRFAKLEDSAVDRVARERSTTPSQLARRLRGDLDWISDRALAKERDERYGSVSELSADVEAHLRHEPIEASPPSRLYSLRKFVRRQRALAATMALLLLALAGGVMARTVEARRANQAAEEALLALEETEQVSQFLIDFFRNSDPWAGPESEVTVREVLDRGATTVRSEFEDRPRIRARFMSTIGSVYLNLGHFDEAEALLLESVSLRRPLAAENPLELAETHELLGDLYWRKGRNEDAELHFRRALTMREKHHADGAEVAESLEGLSRTLRRLGRQREALPLIERAVSIRKDALGPEHPSLARSYAGLGTVYDQLGRDEEAESFLLLGHELTRRYQPGSPDEALDLGILGSFYLRLERLEEAEIAYRRSLEICRESLSADHPLTALAYLHLARIYERQHRADEAGELLLIARPVLVSSYGVESGYVQEIDAALKRLGS